MTTNATQKLIEKAVAELKKTRLGYTDLKPPPSGHWAAALKLLDQAYKQAGPPDKAKIVLGYVVKGPGRQTVLEHDLTHETDGYTAYHSVWPAFDELAYPGTSVLAFEPMEVTGWGSAQGGESVHAKGDSGLLYWFGHVDRRKAVGTKLARGAVVAKVSAEHKEPHVHVAINAVPVLGKDLLHHDNYSHGAPLIGVQLDKAGH